MSLLRNLGSELLWLAAAGVFAAFFWKVALGVEVVAALITITLMEVERRFR